MENLIVCKFGGSSLANGDKFVKVREIVTTNSSRRVVVVSAPGKDQNNPVKITDQLILVWQQRQAGGDWLTPWQAVKERFLGISGELNLRLDLTKHFSKIEKGIRKGTTYEFILSRGEYLCGLLVAEYLGFEFVDAAEVIFFCPDGTVHPITHTKIRDRCKGSARGWVIPGFYGTLGRQTQIFPRNGSDISGAVVAGALQATCYENWSDSPLRVADPRVVNNPAVVREITYREVRELAYLGASVLHQDAVEPARITGVPIRIMDTNVPDDPGTSIVAERNTGGEVVAGVAGKRGFVRFDFGMSGLHDRLGIAADILGVFRDLTVSVEHFPTGTDTMSVVVHRDNLGEKSGAVTAGVRSTLPGVETNVCNGLGLVTVVGLGMVNHVGTMARITGALSGAGVNILMVTQDFRQTNVIVGVQESDLDTAIRCVYNEFFERAGG